MHGRRSPSYTAIDEHSPVEGSEVADVTWAVEWVGSSSFTTINVITTLDERKFGTVLTVQVVAAR